MTLDDFERFLAEDKRTTENQDLRHERKDSKRHHRHHRHHHRNGEDREDHKRKRHQDHRNDEEHRKSKRRRDGPGQRTSKEVTAGVDEEDAGEHINGLSSTKDTPSFSDHVARDAWMEEPSALDIEFTQKRVKKSAEPTVAKSSRADFELKIHNNELNKHHLQHLAEGKDIPEDVSGNDSKHEVDYQFGDAGSRWRMTKLQGVYRRAEETGKSVDVVAEEQYGDSRAFDDAREEQTELDRRDTYGEGYVGKEKPSGELFEERKLKLGLRRDKPISRSVENDEEFRPHEVEPKGTAANTVPLDQTTLNRLKAQMLKAHVRGSSDALRLETEYNDAIARFANSKQPDVVVLGAMDNRMLAGSRNGEVTRIDNKRGRERGLVEENEDMSIEDMVKQERRNRHEAGGDGQRFAERIAKDAKFDNDLDYMDEHANKLAKRVEKSEINLKNTAISDFQKMNRILDKCPLCHHEDTATPPIAPVVSLATRVYLTLPTEPEISDGGACIIPVQHRGNLLECDDDEWEEIRVRYSPPNIPIIASNNPTELHEKSYTHVS